MRRTLTVTALLALTGATLVLAWRLSAGPAATPNRVTERAGLTVERLQSLSTLTTLRVDVADAVATELRGHTGGVKAVLVVRGDYTVGVDLSAARFASVDDDARRAVLVLPAPRVLSVRLDHERTKLVGVWETGLWTIVPGGADADAAGVNFAYRDAQRAIADAAAEPATSDRARRHSEQVLQTFLSSLGWSVDVRWSN